MFGKIVIEKENQILSREQEEQIDSFFANLIESKTLEYQILLWIL